MEFNAAVKQLKSFIPTGAHKWNATFGLEKVRYFLKLLGDPQNGLKFVHIGGTSGKGSTATFLAAILSASGYKTGLHVSPDVITIRERMQINGVCISKERFAAIFTRLQPQIEEMRTSYGTPPSYFEILLAMAFHYFKEEHCDLVVLEVGLGGKLDATNVIDCTWQIITNVGLDHTAVLGDTRELILQDKQEIIKPRSTVVSGISEPGLQQILQQKVAATGSNLFLLGQDFQTANIKDNPDKTNSFDLSFADLKLENLQTGLPGSFQIQNAALAVIMALKLQPKFPRIIPESIRDGLLHARIPGRFQLFSTTPLGIIDGAHNPDKIAALVSSLQRSYPGQRFVTIFRFKKRKDIEQTLTLLKQVSDHIMITRSFKSGDMGLDPVYDAADIAKYSSDPDFSFEPELAEAYAQAKQYATSHDTGILVTGSLYMINEFLKLV